MNEVLTLIFLAICFEFIDSGLGMMYGTLLSPCLLLFGYGVSESVPAILISQAAGGIVGSIMHHKEKSSNFTNIKKELGTALVITSTALLASAMGVVFLTRISSLVMKNYIGVLAVLMGFLCLTSLRFRFSKLKILFISFLAAFNKSATGGGFGPLSTTGLIIGGVRPKESVAITNFSEVFICTFSFLLFYFVNEKLPSFNLMGPLILGSSIGGIFGPKLTARLNLDILKRVVGALAIISGAIVLYINLR